MKIVIDKDIPFARGLFESCADVVYLAGNAIAPDDVRDADALLVRTRTRCNAALLDGSRVRHIATATIGADHIDADWCARNGVGWSAAAGCNSSAVMQYAVRAILHLATAHGIDLRGKTLGIVGVGNIGALVAAAAERLQMRALLNDPPRADREHSTAFVSLNDIAQQADFVTIHTPLTADLPYPTVALADVEFFDSLQRRPLIINASRGETVDEDALFAALHTGKVAGAAIDVWCNEPHINRRLLDAVDLATPHIAGYSLQGKINATAMSANSIARSLNLPVVFDAASLVARAVASSNSQPMPADATFAQLVTASYDILADDRRLRNDPSAFERLRNEYAYRLEPQWSF
jgi:erythronate-4-phosphate dehydrogenase